MEQIVHKWITTQELCKEFQLELVNVDSADIQRRIAVSDINRPGLAMAGFFTYHPEERVQVVGRTEITFFEALPEGLQKERAEQLCAYEQTPCLIVARGIDVPEKLLQAAVVHKLPVLRSSLSTTKLTGRLQSYFDRELALETLVHGVLVDVYGIGILIQGSSGIGKSETALELVKRGHRLVADDAVEIRRVAENILEGTSPELLRQLIEIRGLGVLNVMTLFGAGAIRMRKDIEMVIQLQMWDDKAAYDRLGLDEETIKILDVEVPYLNLPVRPGRNLAVILEVAAMNYRLKRMGYNAAKELTEKMTMTMQQESGGPKY
ncbi:HPr(Ser) kinase/phosphatase [Tumebacillus sp. ITR2]|uniref:HPr kinase/phosphorylase n=1 Tax=Tumebacillus amylolyticus TaxID=2801339 RepID=A0ABS1J9L6_9BACL|nr:HPr(Ser) kinase/phosphatase [Tumebacillus amylolyticus]MBL0386954.1 HPr(Ser) kinase/phosphatase [Tumebacillus amylolyticus]